jgi:hypothetical protein
MPRTPRLLRVYAGRKVGGAAAQRRDGLRLGLPLPPLRRRRWGGVPPMPRLDERLSGF